jgi:hypothetical protein
MATQPPSAELLLALHREQVANLKRMIELTKVSGDLLKELLDSIRRDA